jgi:type IV secretory pathway VirB6-like protein
MLNMRIWNHLSSLANIQRNVALCMLLVFTITFLIITPATSFADNSSVDTTCAKSIKPAYIEPGKMVIESVFNVLQALLSKVGAAMYVQITNTQGFQNIMLAILGLYITVYGAMVTMGLVSHSLAEIGSRLIRIAFFYALLAWGVNGYILFDKYFVRFFLGGMNELIFYVTAAAGGTPVPLIPIAATPPANSTLAAFLAGIGPQTLDSNAVSVLFGPMNKILSPYYLIAILTLLTMKGAGPIFAIGLVYAFIQFAKMIFGALVVYVKAIVGLTFMFGIAPIFIACMLFRQTAQFFQGWLNQVISFAITPVLIFAFLAFFCQLIDNVLISMFFGVDFCMEKLTSVSGAPKDISWWRPVIEGVDDNGVRYRLSIPGEWTLPPAINIINIMFFVLLTHMGKSFNDYVSSIAANISGGQGINMSLGSASNLLKSGATKGRGTGEQGMGYAFGPSAGRAARSAANANPSVPRPSTDKI